MTLSIDDVRFIVMQSGDGVLRDELPPMIDPRHLVGVAEISALFLVGRTTVAMWHTRADRNGFPPLVAQLAMGPLWDVNEVIAWYGSYKPLKGGRPGRVPGADAVPA